jgi:hypothetical protein
MPENPIGNQCILCINSSEIVMIDFDETSLETVEYWANRLLNRFKLDGYIILESSEGNYHVVFDMKVSLEENHRVLGFLCHYYHNVNVHKWVFLQLIKGKSSLRGTSKYEKPSPRIVKRFGSQDNMIKRYLMHMRLMSMIEEEVERDLTREEKRGTNPQGKR